jgi:hypothetical protein
VVVITSHRRLNLGPITPLRGFLGDGAMGEPR